MGVNHLSDNELLNHLTLFYTHDPIVNRLVKMLQSTVMQTEVDALVKMGMNAQTWEFDYEGIDYPISEFIGKLERGIEYRDEEMCDYESRIDELVQERDNLKDRSVADLITELHNEIKFANQRTTEATQKLSISKVNEELATSKLKMWTYLKKDTTV